MPTISLIITTYNWPEALGAVLRSVASQHRLPDEVVIADDGSGQETADLIAEWQAKDGFELRHVWQPDKGFQASRIRNKAVAAATGDYLIFLDGDCLLRPDFVERHESLAEPGFFVAGNRILLSKAFTSDVLECGRTVENWRRSDFDEGQINRSWPLARLPLGPLRKLAGARWEGAKTCNLAVWKSDFVRINGLDESFVGWGYEDSEMVVRLLRNGVRRKDGRFATTVMHLWHAEFDRSDEQKNWYLLTKVLHSGKTRAERGVGQYL